MTQSARPKQHWIPATVLGGFSTDLDRPKRRDRRLHVRHRREGIVRLTAAKNLAYERGLYDMDRINPHSSGINMLDATFNSYERKLSDVFQEIALMSSTLLRFEPWLKVLVPYVAGLTVRGPEFGEQIIPEVSDPELVLVQHSRWTEMSRSVAPIMAADWYLLTVDSQCQFIINDRGFAWASDHQNQREGLLIPIMPSFALLVLPNEERLIAGLNPHGWFTALPRIALTSEQVATANHSLATTAINWFAGAKQEDVIDLEFGPNIPLDRPILGSSWPNWGGLGSHDQDWQAAAHYAGFSYEHDDWHPLGIFSSIETGVRLIETSAGSAILIRFYTDPLV